MMEVQVITYIPIYCSSHILSSYYNTFSLSYAVTSEDYGDSDMLFMFDACQRRVCVDIPIINNRIVEDVEMELHTTLLLYHHRIQFNPGHGVIQIIDDDSTLRGKTFII